MKMVEYPYDGFIQGGAKSGLQLWACETVYLCVIFQANNCKPTFTPSV